MEKVLKSFIKLSLMDKKNAAINNAMTINKLTRVKC